LLCELCPPSLWLKRGVRRSALRANNQNLSASDINTLNHIGF
jgi:hypothetical protein